MIARALLCGSLLASPVWAQPSTERETRREPDRLVLSGRYDHLESIGSGGAGGVSWLRAMDSNLLIEAAAYSNRLGDASWHFGRLGAVARRDRTTFTGSLELGSGKQLEERFLYLFARAGAGYSLIPGTLRVAMDAEYLDVHRTEGLLAKGSLQWQISNRFGIVADYRRSVTNSLNVAQWVGRADMYVDRIQLLGGVAAGTFLDHELLVLNLDAGHQTEWFAGVGVPFGERKLTLVWSTLFSEATRRHSVAASIHLRLGEPR